MRVPPCGADPTRTRTGPRRRVDSSSRLFAARARGAGAVGARLHVRQRAPARAAAGLPAAAAGAGPALRRQPGQLPAARARPAAVRLRAAVPARYAGLGGGGGGAGARPRDSVLSRAVCAGCRCGVRLRGNASVVACEGAAPGAGWPGWAAAGAARPLALSVPGAGLRAVPRAALVELLAPNNSVAALDEADVPETLQVARSLSSEGATEEWNSRLRSFVEIERRLRPRLVAPRCWTCATTASSACRRRRRRGCAACARAWPGTPSPAPAATAPRSRACRTPT